MDWTAQIAARRSSFLFARKYKMLNNPTDAKALSLHSQVGIDKNEVHECDYVDVVLGVLATVYVIHPTDVSAR